MSTTTILPAGPLIPVLPLPPHLPTRPLDPSRPLPPHPPSYASIPPQALTEPIQIGTFSYDEGHVLRHDDSSLQYFVYPPEGASLETGYEGYVAKDESKELGRIDALLEGVVRAAERGAVELGGGEGVMCWRGMMTRLLTALYEDQEGWEMSAMRVDGTVYLEDNVMPEKMKRKRTVTPRARKLTYVGYAFESFCTTPRPPPSLASLGFSGVPNPNVQWCSIVSTSLGPIRLVLGGEVDCVRGEYMGRTGNYVELKTSQTVKDDIEAYRFDRKLLKFWAQSYLLAVPSVVVGFRSPNEPYKLTGLEEFETVSLPTRGVRAGWSATACLGFASAALRYLHLCMQGEGEERVWRVTFVPKQGLSVRVLSGEEAREVRERDGVQRVGFLPVWYWDWVESQRGARGAAMEDRDGGVDELPY